MKGVHLKLEEQNKMSKNKKWTCKTIVGVAFSATIAISVYITKEPMCLLTFILLPIVYAQMGD